MVTVFLYVCMEILVFKGAVCLAVHMSISNPFDLLMEIVSISGAV